MFSTTSDDGHHDQKYIYNDTEEVIFLTFISI